MGTFGKTLKATLAAGLLAGAALPGQAAILYGTDGAGGAGSNLYTINTVTGATTLVGAVGFGINGLEWYNGTLYGTVRANGGLVAINTTTGAGSMIGGFGGPPSFMVELAIDSNGNAYSWGEPGEDDLYSINLATGAATHIGDAGLSTATLGLYFDLADNLSIINCQSCLSADINTATGASSNITIENFYAHHGDTDPLTGLGWGLNSFPGANGSTGINIFDLATRTVTGTLALDRGLHTLAWAGQADIPEPATLALLGLGLVGFARRRNGLHR